MSDANLCAIENKKSTARNKSTKKSNELITAEEKAVQRPSSKSEDKVKAINDCILRGTPPKVGTQRIPQNELVYFSELPDGSDVDEIRYLDLIAPLSGVVYNIHVNGAAALRTVEPKLLPELDKVDDTASLNNANIVKYLKTVMQTTEGFDIWAAKFKCIKLVYITNYDAPKDATKLWEKVHHGNVHYNGLNTYNERIRKIPRRTEDNADLVSREWEEAKADLRKSGLKPYVKDLTTALTIPVFVIV